MMRTRRALRCVAAAILLIPVAVSAQSGGSDGGKWSVELRGGLHLDRLNRPEQVVRSGNGFDAYTGRGEAPTVGVRTTRWLTPHLGAAAGLALAHNASWFGGAAEGALSPVKLTLFGSAAPVWRFFPPESRVQLQVGAGPALIVHGGNGESILTRSTDLGGMALADASVRLSRRLQLTLGAENYRFSSSFVDGGFRRPDGSYTYPAGTRSRSEWIVLTGIRLKLR